MKKLAYYVVERKEHTYFSKGIISVDDFKALCSNPKVTELVCDYRNGDAQAKGKLPAVVWQGYPVLNYDQKGARLQHNLVGNYHYLIDLDHIEPKEDDNSMFPTTPKVVWSFIKSFNDFDKWKIRLAFITPSGKGLKIVAEKDGETSIKEAQEAFIEHFNMGKYFDEVNFDLSRLSFVPTIDDILYLDDKLFELSDENYDTMTNGIVQMNEMTEDERKQLYQSKTNDTKPSKDEDRVEQPETKFGQNKDFEFRGWPAAHIVEKWTLERGSQLGMVVGGVPYKGEVHSLHYNILSDIRNMCENNPYIMTDVIPHFGHPDEEIFAQAKKICSYRTTGKMPYNFWQWLKVNNFLEEPKPESDSDDEDPLASPYKDLIDRMPELPPIIKDWVAAAPYEFKIPTINALLEFLGTLTTYAKATYFDGEEHTSSFFSVIWAPPGGGKSFVKKFNYLHSQLRNREEIISQRERLYDAFVTKKSDNKDAPEKPALCKRFLQPKFSEVQLFTQCFENKGAHLHTYCPEIDTFGRGVKGLSDLLRIAWDNDETGQQFRSSQTFKGTVALFWNVCLTGTPERVLAMFHDVLDGLVTRISITPIFNADFAEYKPWKKIPINKLRQHEKIVARFDSMTYEDPIDEYTPEELQSINDIEEFDKSIKWRFKVRPRISRDLSYLHKPLLKWLKAVRQDSLKSSDQALYTFSKRSANKGFRGGLVANELWDNPQTERGKQKVLDFCNWWTEVEHFCTMYVFGPKYNEKQGELNKTLSSMTTVKWSTIWDDLPIEFTMADVDAVKAKHKVFTNATAIISLWKSEKLLTKIEKKKWKKNL